MCKRAKQNGTGRKETDHGKEGGESYVVSKKNLIPEPKQKGVWSRTSTAKCRGQGTVSRQQKKDRTGSSWEKGEARVTHERRRTRKALWKKGQKGTQQSEKKRKNIVFRERTGLRVGRLSKREGATPP